jgi:asparagine synthase (glutamine-hydrolysing)
LFGGYQRYWRTPALLARTQRIPQPLRQLIAAVIRLPSEPTYARFDRFKHWVAGREIHDSLAESMRKLARGLSARSLHDLYACLSTISFNAHESSSVVRGLHDTLEPLAGPWNESRHVLANMQLWDTAIYLPDDILHKLDTASMAVSLEARVPLLDHRLYDWCWRLPPSLKTSGHLGKLILRQVLRRFLPESLIDRRKLGFSAPLSKWLRGPLREWSLDMLSESSIRRSGLLNHRVIDKYASDFYSGTSSHARLWPILVFLSWYDHHIASKAQLHGHHLRHADHHTVSVGG